AVLARDEPRVVVLDLVVRVPRTLRLGAGADEEAGIVQLRRALRLVAGSLLAASESGEIAIGPLRTEARVAVPPVLPRPRHLHRVDARVAEHTGERADRGLIEVGLVLVRVERLTVADRVPLRRVFAQPPDRPRIVLVDLV